MNTHPEGLAYPPAPMFESPLEIIRHGPTAASAKAVLFDFDGTLSLIRSGWVDVMTPMMVETLADLNSGESEMEIAAVVRDFVDRLTGKQTIYQMIELARQVEIRGGQPEDPVVYKHRYLGLLQQRITGRLDALRTHNQPPEAYLVPGSIPLLEELRSRGLTLYLASGTDHHLVVEEARLLRIEHYFNGGIYGALDDYRLFSKKKLISGLLQDHAMAGEQLLAFGDGYVEIGNVSQVGGSAVGVASDEPHCRTVDQWKRRRLIEAGADIIIPNYECLPQLCRQLFK